MQSDTSRNSGENCDARVAEHRSGNALPALGNVRINWPGFAPPLTDATFGASRGRLLVISLTGGKAPGEMYQGL